MEDRANGYYKYPTRYYLSLSTSIGNTALDLCLLAQNEQPDVTLYITEKRRPHCASTLTLLLVVLNNDA